jgi:hypothetical protein
VLKNAKAAELPIEQQTKFEQVINIKTAKALGLTIPPSVLIRADEIIELRPPSDDPTLLARPSRPPPSDDSVFPLRRAPVWDPARRR